MVYSRSIVGSLCKSQRIPSSSRPKAKCLLVNSEFRHCRCLVAFDREVFVLYCQLKTKENHYAEKRLRIVRLLSRFFEWPRRKLFVKRWPNTYGSLVDRFPLVVFAFQLGDRKAEDLKECFLYGQLPPIDKLDQSLSTLSHCE